MAIRYWKRMREKAAQQAPAAPSPNPWSDQEAEPVIDLNATVDLDDYGAADGDRSGLSAEDRQAQYSDWAARMHQKRQRNRETLFGAGGDPSRSTYWSADALYADSKLVEEDERTSRPNPWQVRELLAILDLDADASHSDVGDAYRRLAKKHHPDRFAGADPETQQLHADKMTRINKAYRALKELQRA